MCLFVWFLEIISFPHSTVIQILPSISLNVDVYVVPGSEFPSTQSTMIHILVIMTLHMTLYVATGDGSFATESTDIWIFYSINLFVEVCLLWVVWCGCTYPISFLWLGIMHLFSMFSVLHCLLPPLHLSLSVRVFFLNPDCNELA